jgi:hypothetical protein
MVAEESICIWVYHAVVVAIGDIPRTEKGAMRNDGKQRISQ